MKNAPRFGLRAACAAIGLATATVFAAEDIDIFAAGAGTVPKPNIMIMLDNSSNWSATLGPNACFDAKLDTKFHAEVCALRTVIAQMTDRVRLGLTMFTETGTTGGYVRAGIRDMTEQNKKALIDLVGGFIQNGTGTDSSGSSQPYGKTMFEVFKYFGGYTNQANAQTDLPGSPVSNTGFGPAAFAGWGTDTGSDTGAKRRDHGVNNATANRAMRSYGADNIYALDNSSDREYNFNNAILDGCAKNFLIVISNGNPGTGGDAGGTDMGAIMSTLAVTPTAIKSGAGTEIHASKFDEMARFLYTTDVSPLVGQQKVITYTIAVYQPQKVTLDANGNVISEVILNTDQEMIKLMKSAASVGGGKYFAARNAQDVVNALLKILNEVQAVNSVFVSASLPVSVNTQGTFLNQVYMGMFRPDGTGNPRWMGNLKQYKFVLDPDTLFLYLADSNNNRAVNPATGFISPSADSFWTHVSTYWTNSQSGFPLSASDKPDGEIVEKGGAAQSVRSEFELSQDTRRMFTCPDTGCTAGALSYEFNESNISGGTYQAKFSPVATPLPATELLSLVRWIRGEDNVNADPRTTLPENWTSAEGGPGLPVTVRPSVHGDVLHSRPVVLNFEGVGPYVFYGANDGTLRAVKGGQASTDGHESWSFVAPEFFPKFKRLRDASPQLLLPSTLPGITPAPLPKDYFFDGPIGSYQDATRAWIFVSARRGGRVIYAFDVSDPTSPKFMWKKTGTDLPNLGQTWSEPKSIKVKASTDPLLIFGAGYDPGEDQIPPVNNGVGRGIYVLNARTGAQVGFFQSASNGGGILHSVPSDVAVIDVDGDTNADRAYVGDTGGNVWRLDIDALSVGSWKLFRLANLAEAGVSRKFFYQPDIVLSKDFHTVLIGTGDREKPLMTTSSDRFYGLRDFKLGTDATGMVALTPSDLVLATTTIDATVKGWYIPLEAGEKVVNSPLTIAGVTYFSTNKPQPNDKPGVCTANLGRARSYGLDFVSGTAGLDRDGNGTKDVNDLYTDLVGGGLPPSPVGGIVQLDDGRLVGFIIGGGESTSPIEAGRIRVDIPKTRQKVYWNTKSDK